MKLLNKDSKIKKGQEYLKSSGNKQCLVTEDGSIFLPESMSYASNRAFDLVKKHGGNGEILTVNAGKSEPKAKEAPAKVEAPVAKAKPKTSKKKK